MSGRAVQLSGCTRSIRTFRLHEIFDGNRSGSVPLTTWTPADVVSGPRQVTLDSEGILTSGHLRPSLLPTVLAKTIDIPSANAAKAHHCKA